MKRTHALLAAVSMFALPTFALAEAVDLRGPVLDAGRTITNHVQTVTEESYLSMDIQGQAMQGTMSVQSDLLTQIDILEVEGEQVTHVIQTIVENTSTTVANFFGQSQEQTTGQEMAGLVLDQTLTEDGWKSEVVGDTGPSLPPETLALIENLGYIDARLLYPEEAVEVGGNWSVEGEALNALLAMAGMPIEISEGEAVFELIEVTTIDGVPTAIITYDVDLTFQMEIEQAGSQMTLSIQMFGSGEIQRSLVSYIETKTFEGTMNFSMVSEQGGQVMMKMTSEMPMTQTITQTDGPAETDDGVSEEF